MGGFFVVYDLFDQAFFLERAECGRRDVGLDFLAVDNKRALGDVGLEDLASLSLGERNVVAVHFTFAGDFADCHGLFLLHGVNDCFESLWLIDGEVGEDFTVKVDAFLLHAGDELRVGKTELTGGIVDAGDPEGTEVALAIATVAVSVAEGFDDALFGEAEATGAIVLHAFGGLQSFLVLGMGGNATFDSHD